MPMQYHDPVGAHRNIGIPMADITWSNEAFQNDDIAGMTFTNCVLENVQLIESNLEQTLFLNCRFIDCTFQNCRLHQTRWVGCKGEGFRIVEGLLSELVITDCELEQLTIEQSGYQLVLAESRLKKLVFNGDGCQQKDMVISGCQIDTALAENARWKGASAVGLDLSIWAIKGAHIEQSSMIQTQAEGLDLSDILFKGCNFYQSNFKKARIQSAEGCIFTECELEELNGKDAQLKGILCTKSKAQKACFDGADLENALFPNTDLTEASFVSAKAKQGIFMDTILTNANLQNLYAYRGCFRNAVMDGVQVDQACLVETDLHGVEAILDGADTTNARGTLEWRAEVEKAAKQPPAAATG